MGRATQCGVNMDIAVRGRDGGVRIPITVTLRDYVDAKYEGLPDVEKGVILHTGIQTYLMEGKRV